MAETKLWEEWTRPILLTLLISLGAYFQLAIVTLSASYFMNKYIYRHGSIRLAMGLLGAAVSIIAFVVILVGHLVYKTKIRYFGLFPLISMEREPSQLDLTYYFQSNMAEGGAVEYIQNLIRRTYGRSGTDEVAFNDRRHLGAIIAGAAGTAAENAARVMTASAL